MNKFDLLGNTWTIMYVGKEWLIEKYNSEHEQKAYFVFGLTVYNQHKIYINDDMCSEQKRKTTMHELMHAYLWEVGVCDNDTFTEEDLCNFSASSHDIIHNIMQELEQGNSNEII